MLGKQDASKVLDSILHLRKSDFFEKLSATSLAPLAYHAREVRFAAGEIVAPQSEIFNQFCHILDGAVRWRNGQSGGIREGLGNSRTPCRNWNAGRGCRRERRARARHPRGMRYSKR